MVLGRDRAGSLGTRRVAAKKERSCTRTRPGRPHPYTGTSTLEYYIDQSTVVCTVRSYALVRVRVLYVLVCTYSIHMPRASEPDAHACVRQGYSGNSYVFVCIPTTPELERESTNSKVFLAYSRM